MVGRREAGASFFVVFEPGFCFIWPQAVSARPGGIGTILVVSPTGGSGIFSRGADFVSLSLPEIRGLRAVPIWHVMSYAFLVILLAVLAPHSSVAVEHPSREAVPSAVVRAYLYALLDEDYSEAYTYLSSRWHNGNSRKDWVEQLRRHDIRPRSEVLFLRVNPAIVRGEEATVVISFQLKTPEGKKVSRQTYDLVREQGRWRIDEVKVFHAPHEK